VDNDVKEAREGLETMTAAAVMSVPASVVRSGASAWDAVGRFLIGPDRHVIVLDEDGRYEGMIGSRHIAVLWPLNPRGLQARPVESLGCAAWIGLRPGDDLRTCAQTLTEYQLDAAPVLDAEKHVIGVVTARDITRAIAGASGLRPQISQE
jgi:CBS domain-containing protein